MTTTNTHDEKETGSSNPYVHMKDSNAESQNGFFFECGSILPWNNDIMQNWQNKI